MRSTLLHLSIALLAFGIGMLSALTSNVEQDIKAQTTKAKTEIDETISVKEITKQPEFVEIKLKDLPCENGILRLVWSELTNEIAEIESERVAKFKSCEDFLEIADFLITDKALDLNNDNVEEIAIRGTENPFNRCGNNCYTYWIFQRTKKNGYRKLFEAEGYLPVVKNEKTLGFRDILFEVYMREFESHNVLYKFNGKEYVPKQCWCENNLYKGKDGDLVVGKKYHTKYYKCEESGFITNYRKQFDSQ